MKRAIFTSQIKRYGLVAKMESWLHTDSTVRGSQYFLLSMKISELLKWCHSYIMDRPFLIQAANSLQHC